MQIVHIFLCPLHIYRCTKHRNKADERKKRSAVKTPKREIVGKKGKKKRGCLCGVHHVMGVLVFDVSVLFLFVDQMWGSQKRNKNKREHQKHQTTIKKHQREQQKPLLSFFLTIFMKGDSHSFCVFCYSLQCEIQWTRF